MLSPTVADISSSVFKRPQNTVEKEKKKMLITRALHGKYD